MTAVHAFRGMLNTYLRSAAWSDALTKSWAFLRPRIPPQTFALSSRARARNAGREAGEAGLSNGEGFAQGLGVVLQKKWTQ